MKLFLLGATGGTGAEFISQGIARGHHITAYVRSPEKLAPRQGLTIVGGSVSDRVAMSAALAGHDAVVTAMGNRNTGATTIRTDSTRVLMGAMKEKSVDRLVVVSAAILFPDIGLVAAFLRATFLRNVNVDTKAADDLVAATPLDWTIVRPPRLTDGARTGKYRLAVGGMPEKFGSAISRADVANGLLDIVEQRSYVRQIVGMSH